MLKYLQKIVKGVQPRIPESQCFYNNNEEALAYMRGSNRWPIILVERQFAQLILKHFGSRPALKILDLGTGPGWIPMLLAKAKPSWDITAVDYSAPMLDKAAQAATSQGHRIRWVRSLAEKTPFLNEQFDVVISHFAFSEFSNPEAVLKEMKRLTKKEGYIIIQDMERPKRWLSPFLELGGSLAHLFSARMRTQYRNSIKGCYTLSEFRALLEKCGLHGKAESIWSNACGLLLRGWMINEAGSSKTPSEANVKPDQNDIQQPLLI
jgi:ubiquinone/menaquinone biosynthesis C-methylase UbiE